MTNERYDLVVVGAGAAGLTASIVAHSQGLSVLIVEKARYVGGTTSFSGGACWVPNSRQQKSFGEVDSEELAMQYLDSTVRDLSAHEARREYIRRSPEAIEYIESVSHLKFNARPYTPDYSPDAPGAQNRGRVLLPEAFDGRLLGENFKDIRPPLPELCLFGKQMLDGADVQHLLNAKRSPRSAVHALKLMLSYAHDRIVHRKLGRGTRLTGGNAMVGRLYQTVLEENIPVRLDTPLVGLKREGARVTGVIVSNGHTEQEIGANCGVVLATGGFPWGEELRKKYVSDTPFGYSAASPDNTGDAISIAIAGGAKLAIRNTDSAFWTPVSIGPRADGTMAHFPHLMADRSKPGLIAVNKAGRRFFNESENYHDFVRAMTGKSTGEDQQPVHLICDHTFVIKYVFGMVPPLASARRKHIRSGYLIRAETIDGLAAMIGVNAQALHHTLDRYNRDAVTGLDAEFGKGSTEYNRNLGDPLHKPNPCLAPIQRAPFYALKVVPGDIGTTRGLAADAKSRVLDEDGKVIDGLYVCGNDRDSIMGGAYPSGGITLGPALTFAYLAALDAASSKAATPVLEQMVAR